MSLETLLLLSLTIQKLQSPSGPCEKSLDLNVVSDLLTFLLTATPPAWTRRCVGGKFAKSWLKSRENSTMPPSQHSKWQTAQDLLRLTMVGKLFPSPRIHNCFFFVIPRGARNQILERVTVPRQVKHYEFAWRVNQ